MVTINNTLPWKIKTEIWGYQVLDFNGDTVILDTCYYPEAPELETSEFIVNACNAHTALVEALSGLVAIIHPGNDHYDQRLLDKARAALAMAGVK